jgi:hypothetical protein
VVEISLVFHAEETGMFCGKSAQKINSAKKLNATWPNDLINGHV